jgi:ketosteroid isomerase-like protein
MISREFAERFSKHWVDSWNNHDLEAILSHYSDDFEMSSPYIIQIAGEPSGKLKGKAAVGAYWSATLKQMPYLHFELVETLVGVESITLYYRGARGMVAEVFQFNADGIVVRASAHYA